MSSGTVDEPLVDRLRAALLDARRARDAVAVRALRTALGAIDAAGAVPAVPLAAGGSGSIAGAAAGLGAAEVARREVSEHDVVGIVRAEVAERHDAAVALARAGRLDAAEELRAEAAVLVAHLPGA